MVDCVKFGALRWLGRMVRINETAFVKSVLE